MTTAYSIRIKQVALLDVFFLAGLYTMRLIGGHAATGIKYSFWLLAFSMFIFLSLALVKRFTELKALRQQNQRPTPGAAATPPADLELVAMLGIASGFMAVMVMALYVNSKEVQSLYRHHTLLLMVCPLLLYWISRIWLIAHRGQMHSDPIVFALKDRASYFIGAAHGVRPLAGDGPLSFAELKVSQRLNSWFHDAVSALAYSIGHERADAQRTDLQPPYNDVTQFILQQHSCIAAYLRAPLMAATLGFDLFGILRSGKRFHKMSPESRARQMGAWRDSKIGFQRDLIRYFESLTLLELYSRESAETDAREPNVSGAQSRTAWPEKPSPPRHRTIAVMRSS